MGKNKTKNLSLKLTILRNTIKRTTSFDSLCQRRCWLNFYKSYYFLQSNGNALLFSSNDIAMHQFDKLKQFW